MKRSFLRWGLNILFCMTLLVSIILVADLCLSGYIARKAAKDVIYKAHTGIVEQMDNYMESLEQCAYFVAYTPDVNEALVDYGTDSTIISNSKDIRMVFSAAFVFSRYLNGIALYDGDGRYLISSGVSKSSKSRLDEEYRDIKAPVYSQADETDGELANYWLIVYPVYSKEELLGTKTKRVGYLVFTVNREYIHSLFTQNDYYDVAHVLLDKEKRTIYSNREAVLERGSIKYESPIKHSGWVLQSIQSDSLINEEMKPLLVGVSGTLILIIIVVLYMRLFFWREIRWPLNELDQFMRDTTDLTHRLDTRNMPRNELFETMTLLNQMMDELESKNKELLYSQTRALQEEMTRQQMEIIAYRNQINPHFLYNTLDCIRGMAYAYDAPEIVQISQSLSAMFRYAVKGENWVTLEQELGHIMNYALIIGFRFSNRIMIEHDIDDRMLQQRVIKLILQPLVENAVLHGLEKKLGQGHVMIRGRMDDDRMTLSIEDDGCGMTPGRIAELKQAVCHVSDAVEMPSQTGVGLSNIARRLFLHYHGQARMDIRLNSEGGMTVDIEIPLNSEESGSIRVKNA